MFSKSDFWIGMGVGIVAGVFGYKLMLERGQQLMTLQQTPVPTAQAAPVPMEELLRQKEELEDLIAAQSTGA